MNFWPSMLKPYEKRNDRNKCNHSETCSSSDDRTLRNRAMFSMERGITSLPFSTFVNARNEVIWNNANPFEKDWRVVLESSYNHQRSKYEGEPGFFSFKPPTVIDGPVPFRRSGSDQNSSNRLPLFVDSPYMIFSRTHHDDNAGHLIFDTYHPLLTVINSHLGLSQAKNVTTVDLVWNSQIFSRWSEVFDKKWKLFIGHVLLKRQIHFRNFLAENRAAVRSAQQGNSKHSNAVVCYRKLIVGCGQLSGLDGGTLHRSQSLQHIRRVIWDEYAPDNASSASPNLNEVRILMLEKNTSSWQHSNYITNWQEMVSAVRDLPDVVVTAYSPQYQTFKTQVIGYRTTDIVISLWGGISMLNFLLRPGRVEIVITSWFEDNGMMPLPNRTTAMSSKKRRREEEEDRLECPDFDSRARMGQDIKHLRFCTRDNGHTANHIRLDNFIPLVQRAVRYIRWKKKSGFELEENNLT
eukprot:gene27626-36429_t